MRRVAAIVTDQGGRTAHAAIVSREFGIPCIVGSGNATEVLHDGDEVTVACCEGPRAMSMPDELLLRLKRSAAEAVPQTRTQVMLTAWRSVHAPFKLSFIPNDGVGLARTEFIVTNHIGIHPMALARYPNLKDRTALKEIAFAYRQRRATRVFCPPLQRRCRAYRGCLLSQTRDRSDQRFQVKRICASFGRQ